MSDTKKDPYREGYEAFEAGEQYTADPYPYDSEESGRWNDGWNDADMESEEAESAEGTE